MTDDHYLDPYRASARQHGSDFEVTLWANPRTQQLRFEVFAQMIPLADKRIVDAGCSRGDLAVYLLDQQVPFQHYTGIDGLSDPIQFANTRGLERCEFIQGNFVVDPGLMSASHPDVICISGALNTMADHEALDALQAAWGATEDALIFNFLSDRARLPHREQTGPARRLNALAMLDWAMEHTPMVAFRQDYFPGGHDATILMRKVH